MNKEELLEMFNNYVDNRGQSVLYRSDFEEFIEIIISKHHSAIGELSAKVYTYEKIIEKSNFAPILQINIKEVDKE